MWLVTLVLGLVGVGIVILAVLTLATFQPIGPGSEVDPAPGKNACALVTRAELEAAAGRRIDFGAWGDFRSECLWAIPGVSFDPAGPDPTFAGVDIRYSTVGNYSDWRNGLKPDGETREVPVSGIGDQVFVVEVRLRRTLWVRRGRTVLVIDASISTTDPENISIEERIATLALPRA